MSEERRLFDAVHISHQFPMPCAHSYGGFTGCACKLFDFLLCFFLPGPGLGPTLSVSAPTPSVSAVEKLRSIRTEFIERVTEPVLRQLLDKLLDCGVVTDHEMESVVVIANRADKAREVIDTVRKKGEAACSDLIRALCEVDPCLSKQLKLM